MTWSPVLVKSKVEAYEATVNISLQLVDKLALTLAASANGQFNVCLVSKSYAATAANTQHRAVKVSQQTHTATKTAWLRR